MTRSAKELQFEVKGNNITVATIMPEVLLSPSSHWRPEVHDPGQDQETETIKRRQQASYKCIGKLLCNEREQPPCTV
jgi:hypothetical protein